MMIHFTEDAFTKTSQVFKHCHTLVANHDVDFICHAIYCAEFGSAWTDAYANAFPFCRLGLPGKFRVAYDRVHELLGNNKSLESWLRRNTENYYHLRDTTSVSFFEYKVRETRLAWLKSLIEEFEAKGD